MTTCKDCGQPHRPYLRCDHYDSDIAYAEKHVDESTHPHGAFVEGAEYARNARPTVKFKRLHKDAVIPRYQTSGAAGMDLHSLEEWAFQPGERYIVHIGLAVEIPAGYEGQIRSRSGTAINHGLVVLNAPGTVDPDFRGELGAILINHSSHAVVVKKGARIAQLVIAPVAQATIVEVEELSETARGTGGWGSTGR